MQNVVADLEVGVGELDQVTGLSIGCHRCCCEMKAVFGQVLFLFLQLPAGQM
jgi:hypothetical protein